MKRGVFQSLLLFFAAFVLISQSAFSQGNLLISPIRVKFENGKQKEDLNLTNIGQDTAVYLVSFLKYRMTEDGSFQSLAESDTTIQSADKFLRIFPRRVILPPNESQTISLQLRKPVGIKDGEYRSHLYFRAEKDITPRGLKVAKADSSSMAVRITPIFGISIPVIVQFGNLNLNLSLSDMSYKAINDSTAQLSVNINREGEKSSYGDLKVQFVPKNGRSVEIGMANGIAVYTEVKRRKVIIPLNTKGAPIKSGKLVVVYSTTGGQDYKELAKSEFVVR